MIDPHEPPYRVSPNQSRSIDVKRTNLPVVVTVKSSSTRKKFSNGAGLRCCETIEWE